MVERGVALSRERAKALVMEGKVLVDGEPVTKAGIMVSQASRVELKANDIPYVSRGGLKLQGALDHFDISVNGMTVMDIGASTGGFTDCLLQRGARRVYCVDVGYGQLAWKLQQDPRVVILDRTNVRFLKREAVPEQIDLTTIDVSFISLTKVIPCVIGFLRPGAVILALVKPQFEVGKAQVGKGGIVKDEASRRKAVEAVAGCAETLGLTVVGVVTSNPPGQKGNVEYFLCLRKPSV
jgi:23S rRNA (cytidine1920-2'-O)/16S rRNA (cytidine1409-2'-O)-methyltransferase